MRRKGDSFHPHPQSPRKRPLKLAGLLPCFQPICNPPEPDPSLRGYRLVGLHVEDLQGRVESRPGVVLVQLTYLAEF